MLLMRHVKRFRDRDEFDRALSYFHELEAKPHPAPDPAVPFNYVEGAYEETRDFFEEQGKRFESK
jgi:hypothetical protein